VQNTKNKQHMPKQGKSITYIILMVLLFLKYYFNNKISLFLNQYDRHITANDNTHKAV